MKGCKKLFFIFFLLITGCATQAPSPLVEQPNVKQFIHQLVIKDHFKQTELINLFNQVHIHKVVIHHSNHPKELMPNWLHYRAIFLTQKRIRDGAQFWQQHSSTMSQAEQTYGVPPQIIAAIIGVETAYGKNLGKFKVMDSLSTLAFINPHRQLYFQTELAQYLLLTRDLHLNPLDLYGSYAGAVGLPQFMPSNYRTLAISADPKKSPDLWHQPNDAILSVANFFNHKGWQANQPIAVPAKIIGQHYLLFKMNPRLGAFYTLAQLQHYGIEPATRLPENTLVNLIALPTPQGKQYWLACHNFYVITHYNTSVFYAMAVYQLSVAIKDNYERIH